MNLLQNPSITRNSMSVRSNSDHPRKMPIMPPRLERSIDSSRISFSSKKVTSGSWKKYIRKYLHDQSPQNPPYLEEYVHNRQTILQSRAVLLLGHHNRICCLSGGLWTLWHPGKVDKICTSWSPFWEVLTALWTHLFEMSSQYWCPQETCWWQWMRKRWHTMQCWKKTLLRWNFQGWVVPGITCSFQGFFSACW